LLGFFFDYYLPIIVKVNGKATLASFTSLWLAGFQFIIELNEKLIEILNNENIGRISMMIVSDISGFIAIICIQLLLF